MYFDNEYKISHWYLDADPEKSLDIDRQDYEQHPYKYSEEDDPYDN